MAWEYKRDTSSQFEQLPEGRYRIRIRSVEKAVSKSGNDMLVFQFDVSGTRQILYHYITFLADRPEITNRQLTQFFDCFKDIPDGDFNIANWVGKVGAAQIKHDDSGRAKIHYFIRPKQAEELPAWKEPGGVTTDKDGFMKVNDLGDDVPQFI